MPNYYRDFQKIFSSTGRLDGAVLYILYDYKPTKFKDTCKNLKYSAEDHISQIFEELNENMINDLEYIHNHNIMCVIDDIDNKLTLCHDSILKEKNIIEVINDLRPTSNILEQINEEGNKYHEILYEICYDSDYFNSNDDPIERYLYQLINHIYYPFLEYFEDLCKKHDIDIFAIQRKIGRYIIEDDEFEDYKSENLNSSLPKQIVIKTNHFYPSHTKDKVEKIYNEFINKSFIEQSTDINDFNYVFGHNNQLDKEFTPINWIVSQNLLAYFLNKTFSENDTNYLQIAYNAFRIKNKNINKNKMSSFMSECRRGSESPPMYYKIIDELLT